MFTPALTNVFITGQKEDVAQQMESTLGDIAVAETELQQLKEENRAMVSNS
jgi:hypothetical protein